MKKTIFITIIFLSVAFSLSAQTHYLYVAGGREADALSAGITPQDTLALINSGADIDFINVLVADVDVAAKTVSNWRIAGVLPARHPYVAEPDNVLQWSYIADNVNYYNGRLYVGPATFNGTGPITADFIAYADINPDGSLGTFNASERFPTTDSTNQRISATEIIEIGGTAYLYVIGGNHDEANYSNRIIYAAINPGTGALGPWNISSTTLPQYDWFAGAVAHQGTITHVRGNLGGTRSLDWVTPSGTGDITSAFTNLPYDGSDASSDRWDYGITKTTSGGNTYLHIIAGAALGTPATTSPNADVFFLKLDSATGVPSKSHCG